MSDQNLLNSICTLIFPCFNFTTESLIRPNSNSELPPAVILEILLKLPIKTILRCRCVSKSWQNLISDPYFANIYLKTPPFTALALSRHRTITNPLDSERLFVVEIGENGDIVHIPFNPKAMDVPRNGIFGIMGSCNGLLCLVESPHIETENHGNYVFNRDSIYNNQNIYVVNPLTGERTLLPEVEGAENIRDVVYGFGSSTDDARCKVLRVVMRYIVVGFGHEIKVDGKIFTVGVDENWRDYEDSTIPCYLFPYGVTLNGVLHFVGDNRRSGLIYAFDIEEEKGRCIPLPSRLGDEAGVIVLAKWNGHLCLTDNSNDRQVDIWTMREYGVEESWTRDIVVRSSIPSSLRLSPFIPVTTMRNGDLLMSCSYGESLVTFDPKTKNYTEFVVSNVEGTISFMFDFVPSFVTQNFSPI